MTTVAVYCSSKATCPRHLAVAADVGLLLARAGHDLVYGGGSLSSMGAVAATARQAGAAVVGVTLPAWAELGESDVIVTPDLGGRKAEMERRADAFLVLASGVGALDELFSAWVSASTGMHTKPIVVLDPDGLWAPLWPMLDHLVTAGYVTPPARDMVQLVTTAAEAVAEIAARLQR